MPIAAVPVADELAAQLSQVRALHGQIDGNLRSGCRAADLGVELDQPLGAAKESQVHVFEGQLNLRGLGALQLARQSQGAGRLVGEAVAVITPQANCH